MRFLAPFTVFIIIVSVLTSLYSKLGVALDNIQLLFITTFSITPAGIAYQTGLPEISNGEIWRLVTPAFIHFGILHLVFNSLWLWDLGRAIEFREGSKRLILMVLVLSILSNLGQYYVSGPSFGGMSGVVYGLLGYLWIRGKYDPFYGLTLRKEIIWMMLIWFVICLLGLVGNIGNTAHGVGLAVGMLLGFIAARRSLASSKR